MHSINVFLEMIGKIALKYPFTHTFMPMRKFDSEFQQLLLDNISNEHKEDLEYKKKNSTNLPFTR